MAGAELGSSVGGAENKYETPVSAEMGSADGLALAIEGCAGGVMGLVRWPDRPEVEPGEDILVGALYRYRAGRQDASRRFGRRGRLVEY